MKILHIYSCKMYILLYKLKLIFNLKKKRIKNIILKRVMTDEDKIVKPQDN